MATIYVAVETHPDRCIGGVFASEKRAEDFRQRNYNAPYGCYLYNIFEHEVDDDDILALAETIKKNNEESC